MVVRINPDSNQYFTLNFSEHLLISNLCARISEFSKKSTGDIAGMGDSARLRIYYNRTHNCYNIISY